MIPLPPPIEYVLPDGSVAILIAEATLTPEEDAEALAIHRELADRRDAQEKAA